MSGTRGAAGATGSTGAAAVATGPSATVVTLCPSAVASFVELALPVTAGAGARSIASISAFFDLSLVFRHTNVIAVW